jgi:flavin reductase (DIM6/NTAB) family NADH-FMN oxidoreductase RutF
MVSVGHNQASHDLLRDGACFGVNLLRADQAELSNRFAGLQEGVTDRFEGVAHRSVVSGAPILDDCLAWFDCRLEAMHVVGDHTLFIGAVLAGEVVSAAPPLIFYNGGYPALRLKEDE